jgi:hypothetical protein
MARMDAGESRFTPRSPSRAPGPLARLALAASFGAASAVDALVAPVAALRRKHRVARAAFAEAGLPLAGGYAADVRRVRARRRQRRMRLRLFSRGPQVLSGSVEVLGIERLRETLAAGRGAILVSTHGGPPEAIPAALRLHGIDAFELREAQAPPWDPPMRVAVLPNRSGAPARTTVLLACLAELRRGGAVRLTLEGHGRRSLHFQHGARIGDLPIPAGGGAGTLARLSGAPAFPVVAAVGAFGRTRVVVGESVVPTLPAGAPAARWEAAFVERANAEFERLLEHDPAARLERLLWAIDIRGWGGRPAPAPASREVLV